MAQQDDLGETNRKFFDEHGESLFQQEWAKNLTAQLRDCLLSSIDFIGIRKSSPGKPPVKLLDYACGTGVVSQALLDHADIIRGVDISESMVSSYNEFTRQAGIPPQRMAAVRGNIVDTDDASVAMFDDPDLRELDVIVMSMALHHVSSPAGFLEKLVERLSSGGVIVILDRLSGDNAGGHTHHHGHHHSHEPAKPLTAQHTTSRIGFTRDEMVALFAGAGCTPDSVGFRPYKEPSHIPESVVHVKGGIDMTFFIAKARKL